MFRYTKPHFLGYADLWSTLGTSHVADRRATQRQLRCPRAEAPCLCRVPVVRDQKTPDKYAASCATECRSGVHHIWGLHCFVQATLVTYSQLACMAAPASLVAASAHRICVSISVTGAVATVFMASFTGCRSKLAKACKGCKAGSLCAPRGELGSTSPLHLI